jgi:two-component system sensor histidine kinase YesM
MKLGRKLLIAFLCLNIALTVFVVTFIIGRTSQTMYEGAGNSALIASDQIRENIRNKLIGYVSVSEMYYSDLYFQALLAEEYASDFDSLMMYQNYTRPNMQRNLNNAQFNRISIYLDNESYLKDGVFFQDEAEIADKAYARGTIAARGRVCWSAPEKNAQGQDVFYMTRMLNALDVNHPAGLFLMEIPTAQVFSLFAHEAVDKDILIANGDGFIVSSSDAALLGRAVRETPYAPFFEREDGRIHRAEVSGVSVNAISETIDIPGNVNAWRMLSLIPMDGMYADIDDVLRQSFWASGIGLFLSAIMIWVLSRGLTKRLTLLSRNIDQVKAQHFDRIVDISGNDEIGTLANDFNIMAAHIDELINQIYKEQLKQMDLLVRQRDAELDALQSRINPHFSVQHARQHSHAHDTRRKGKGGRDDHGAVRIVPLWRGEGRGCGDARRGAEEHPRVCGYFYAALRWAHPRRYRRSGTAPRPAGSPADLAAHRRKRVYTRA